MNTRAAKKSSKCLEQLCSQVVLQLHQRLTLDDLVQMGGMSARTLQYAFRTQFQCTPMQWIKRQRMDRARILLLSAKEFDTVIQIAMACHFPNPGLFASDYKKEYGELPSTTLYRIQEKTSLHT